MKKVNELLICAIMLDLLIVYVQFMIMLIELKKMLSQELKCLCSKTKSGTKVFVCVVSLSQSNPNEPYQKLWI
jgi:hypothetical protein